MEIRSAQDLDAALRIQEMERVRKVVTRLRGRSFLRGQPQLIIQIPLLGLLLFSRVFGGDIDLYLVGVLFLVTIATSVMHEALMRDRMDALVELLQVRGLLPEVPEPNEQAASRP